MPPQAVHTRPPLRRATGQSGLWPTPWLAGVCSGLSVHLGMSVGLIRALMVLFVPVFGIVFLFYLWLWVMIPREELRDMTPESPGLTRGLTSVTADHRNVATRNRLFMAGIIMLGIAITAVIIARSGALDLREIIAILAVIVGLGLVWSQGGNLSNWQSVSFLGAVSSGAVLLIFGIVLIVGRNDPPLILLRGGLLGAAVVAGVLFAFAPLWLRTSKDLSAVQRQQVRDAERADIAAHLHDSVLQALTLIRSSADDPTRVRAIALTEERELRSWLYTGHDEVQDSLARAVKETVGGIESRYGIAVDVVTVSDMRPGPGEIALIAALGEAVANAVRHGAPPVSVYVEVRRTVVEAFIKDSGGGFRLEDIPSDRHGVRDSIIGRMERAGGSARIRTLAVGTEVSLSIPRTEESGADSL